MIIMAKTQNPQELAFGVEKVVMDKDGRTHKGCFGCPHCNDTGFSYICGLTGEKLEGFDSMEDKRNKNLETLFRRNILVGVGNSCPLATINKDAMTKIKFTVSLEEIAEFVEAESCFVRAEVDEDEDQLELVVSIYDDGYENNRDFMFDELSDMVDTIEDKFNVVVEDGDDEDSYLTMIITLP